jgi:ribonuclease HI
LPNGKSPGCDGIPREFYKYGPMILLEHLRSAINAYTKGRRPSEFAHEWEGSIVSLIPKTPAAIMMTDERPIACECSKYIIATTIYNDRLSRVMEDFQLLDDAQEGFRRHRSTKRQVSKLQGLLAQQCRDKSQSVVLFLDIKNAFNAVNHRAIFSLLEAYGFNKVDVDFFRQMYSGKFFSVGNTFGESAACFLRRGVFQGDTPSPNIFNLAFDPAHKMVRASGRGCLAPGMDGPSGSSGFADDTALHTGGSDAIPAMRALVNSIGPLLKWLGMSLNMSKSYISAINFATGQAIPTVSITFDGKPFSVLPPDQPHKHLGIRMTLTGDFCVEKAYVRAEMQRRIKELMDDKVLPPSLKELAIKIGVISVFRYSAGAVPWTRTELDEITDMWIRAYKQAWFKAAARGMDSSPFVLDKNAGGRQCPSAIEVWMRDVLDTLDQCMTLPCEIAQFILFHLRQECCDHGCAALNQMQSLLRITGNNGSESLLKLLLLRLDEQGLEVSTPWAPQAGLLISGILWPQLWCAWRAKEASSLIDHRAPLFSSGEAHATWEQAKQCLLALSKLGQAGIIMVSELRGQAGHWLSLSEVRLRSSHLTTTEYQTLCTWLDQAPAPPAISVESTLEPASGASPMHVPHHRRASDRSKGCWPPVSSVTLPPCVRGCARSIQSHDRVQLEPRNVSSRDALCTISDHDLAVGMCQARSIFSFSTDESTSIQVECLVPLRVFCPSATCPESIIVQDLSAERFVNQFTVLTMAFVRDSLVAIGAEYLRDACCRPPWLVPKEELQRWFTLHSHPGCSSSTSQWILDQMDKDGQQVLRTSISSLQLRRPAVVHRSPVLLHPWQCDPKLPDLVRFDLSNHYVEYLLSPTGWTVAKRNARVIITSPSQDVAGLDAAQYSMLADPHGTGRAPSEAVLKSIVTSYLSQLVADGEYHVAWSRHLLSSLHRILKVDLLIGARAVTTTPQFLYFASPEPQDYLLGAVTSWPQTPALLLLDSIAPEDRASVLHQAASHGSVVWILRQDRPSPEAVADLARMRSLHACLMAILPPRSMVLHDIHCWSTAKWDSEPSRCASQIWLLCSPAVQSRPRPEPCNLQQLLGQWEKQRYDFYLPMEHPPSQLLRHRAGQQDAPLYTGQGLFAGSDGSVNYKKERMGIGYVVTQGMDLAPIHRFSAPVGGPLASIRAEAVGLLCLLKWLRDHRLGSARVTVFIDCLGLLQILSNWGRVDFWPDPKDIIHFDVLLPLLQVLREWTTELVLVKVKSHAGCYHNEMADECADAGCMLDDTPLFSGPQKYGTLHLRLQPSLHTLVEKEHLCATLPRDGAPNASILRQVVSVNTKRAVNLRNTIFVREVMYRPESAIIARVIVKSSDSEVRCWMQAMTGTYPVASYLHKIGKAASKLCPHCASGANETLSHFLSVCPRFHDARTAAHNQIRARLSSSLKRHLPRKWKLYEEAAMLRTGLQLRPVSSARVRETGRCVSEADLEAGRMSLSRWQPDFVSVSFKAKKIAILELCRPSDTSSGQLQAAYERKRNLYGPLVEALGHYSDSGWSVKILPWVVGARGLVLEQAMHHALEYLEVPKTFWRPIIEDTVLASISALAFMHRIRFSPPALVQHSEAINPSLQINRMDDFLQCGAKRKNGSMHEGLDTTMVRWRKMVATPREQRGAGGNADTTT